MVGIQGLDVCRSRLRPVVDDGGRAALAAGLIGQLPREDGGGRLVPVDYGLDVLEVLRLGRRVGVPAVVIASEGVDVGVDSAIVVPGTTSDRGLEGVFRGGTHQLLTKLMMSLMPFFSAEATTVSRRPRPFSPVLICEPDALRYWNPIRSLAFYRHELESLRTLRTVVILGNRVHVVETPNTKDPESRSLEMTQDKVHVGRVGEETAPVAVSAGVVLGHAVDAELGADGLGKAGAGRGRGRRRP